ncbi:MAG TPA: GntR family transcriptional regulator [Candidatus Dormibacteraeota bacterium]|nr:GntR family transcriptional regulator [Candidatus Dormibacteraeota bacterium]
MTIRRYNLFMPVAQNSLLYSRVEAVLASEITDGLLKVGGQLPTEDALIARFKVSRITVRRAIRDLVNRGLVEIRRGKGTFVAAPRITQELTELSGFVEDMHALGRKPTARVLSKEIVTADATVASQLALTPGQRVVRIRRVRLADGVPLSFDETYLELEIGRKIITNNLKVEPIFTLLERKYGVPLIEAEYKLDATAADSEVAAALRVKENSPVFRIERTSYSTNNRPVDYERLYYRSDLIRFVTRLARKSGR